jgi:hypothetical protein
MSELTDQERKILDIEKSWWAFSGAKEQAIRDRLNISAVTFYQRLNTMLDDPRIEAAEPVLVHRLQRLRAQRQRSRSARRAG